MEHLGRSHGDDGEMAVASTERTPGARDKKLAPGSLGVRQAILIGAWFGLFGGFLDVAAIVLKKHVFYSILYYRLPQHFFWTLPVVNLALVLLVGLVLVGVHRVRPSWISQRSATWALVMLALWEPLLRMPVHGLGSLVLAAGLGRWLSSAICKRAPRSFRLLNRSFFGLVGLLAALAAASTGRSMWAEHQALQHLPPPPSGAPNVLLVVMDTVRAESLSLHDYSRDTSPELTRWARRGVRFERAVAPSSWTFPSHCCLLTAQWPSRLKSHWQLTLDASYPTLADHMAGRGYLTAGFVANTNFCSYESGLNRGFAHFEDYPSTLRIVVGSSAMGRWILKNLVSARNYYQQKWIDQQSQDAHDINRSFLEWQSSTVGGRRPFFAFLNYLDAHEPFVCSPGASTHFGVQPQTAGDYRKLLEFWELDKIHLSPHDIALAHDAYEDCIASLDHQVGVLLSELEHRGLLENTVVILTSDHGEEFGEHGLYNHGYGLNAPEVCVPLVVLAPGIPAGRVVSEAVSLRDVPATILDMVGLASGSPFPGHSLTKRWSGANGSQAPSSSPALSEVLIPTVLPPSKGPGPSGHGLTMSLIKGSQHYILDSQAREAFFDQNSDPLEQRNLADSPDHSEQWRQFRRRLLGVLLNEYQPSARATGARSGPPDPAAIVASGSLRQYRAMLESLMRGQVSRPGHAPSK